MSPSKDDRRPTAGAAASVIHLDIADPIAARCWICGRPLRAAASVRLGIGPKCLAGRMGAA